MTNTECTHDSHNIILMCNGSEDYGKCLCCGMRSPSVPHNNYHWGCDLFKEAEEKGTLFKDT